MTLHTLQGKILTPHSWVEGQIQFAERILAIAPNDSLITSRIHNPTSSPCWIMPGFIDCHVHGAGGADVMQMSEKTDAIHKIARTHAQHGTTSFLATTMTAPLEKIEAVFHNLHQISEQRLPYEARVLGVHLEGPFINKDKLGAQPNAVQAASLENIKRWHELFPIKVLTMAPEVNGNMALIAAIKAMGIQVQLGHSQASYEECLQAMQQGASSYTHLYNAMSALHHRAPGMVGAALAHTEFAEIIPDLLHVHEGAIKAALRAIPQLFCVTDSTAATSMPDGEYMLGAQQVQKCMGGVRLADGTLAGSCLSLDVALRNLVKIGLSLEEASKRVSTYAANFLGLENRGSLQAGAYADIVVLDDDLDIIAVYVEGEKVV